MGVFFKFEYKITDKSKHIIKWKKMMILREWFRAMSKNNKSRFIYILFICIGFLYISCQSTNNGSSSRKIIIKAHSHNDYVRNRPLFDALSFHFASVEADIHLVDGTLYVAHDNNEIDKDRTLQSLYFDPLQQRIENNGGYVYDNNTPLTLLVDLKTDAEPTYRALTDIMKKYEHLFTVYHEDKVIQGPVIVIISGNRPLEFMKTEKYRYAFYDGRLEDLDSDLSSSLMPLISDNWTKHFTWNGKGKISNEEQDKLEKIVHNAHKMGREVRFWQTDVDTVEYQINIWNEFLRVGVDFINTDKLTMLNEYLNEKK